MNNSDGIIEDSLQPSDLTLAESSTDQLSVSYYVYWGTYYQCRLDTAFNRGLTPFSELPGREPLSPLVGSSMMERFRGLITQRHSQWNSYNARYDIQTPPDAHLGSGWPEWRRRQIDNRRRHPPPTPNPTASATASPDQPTRPGPAQGTRSSPCVTPAPGPPLRPVGARPRSGLPSVTHLGDPPTLRRTRGRPHTTAAPKATAVRVGGSPTPLLQHPVPLAVATRLDTPPPHPHRPPQGTTPARPRPLSTPPHGAGRQRRRKQEHPQHLSPNVRRRPVRAAQRRRAVASPLGRGDPVPGRIRQCRKSLSSCGGWRRRLGGCPALAGRCRACRVRVGH